MIWWLLACQSQQDFVVVESEPAQLLRRLSLDLRGVLPAAEEQQRLQQEQSSLDVLRDEYLSSPLLQERVVDWYGEQWHTLIDVFDVVHQDYYLDDEQEYPFERAVGEEPLRLIASVISSNQHYSELVTAEHSMANPLLEGIWPLELEQGADGQEWRVAHYTDGRPAMGVLSTNGLWWRYTTDESNMNRGRAAAVSRLLLCEDPLSRPVSFSAVEVSELAEASVETAIRQNPACQSCHATLDPLASSLFGFWWLELYSSIEHSQYHPEREHLGAQYLGTEMAYFGAPLQSFAELGTHLAADPRLYSCATETMARALWRRPIRDEDAATLHRAWQRFAAAGFTSHELIRALTDELEYSSGLIPAALAPEDQWRYRSQRMMSPALWASVVEQLTGFRWAVEGFDLHRSDHNGYRVLMGGVDGLQVYAPQSEPGVTWAMAVKRSAQLAAAYVAEADLESDNPKLLTVVSPEDGPGDEAFTTQLQALHQQLYAVPATAEWITESTELWSAVDQEAGTVRAWASVISVALRDPAFLFY